MTRVVAHRCRVGPGAAENLASGVVDAARAGADAVEVDVRLTRDGVAVVSHDAWLARRTGWPVPVNRVTASWFRARRDRTTGEALPDLATVVTAAVRAGIGVVADLKDRAALAAVAAVLRQASSVGRDLCVRDPCSIGPALASLPGVTVGWLGDPRSPEAVQDYLRAARVHGAGLVSVRHDLVTAATVERCRASSLRLAVWVTDPGALPSVLALQPDTVVTDRADLVVR